MLGLGFTVYGLRFRVQGSGFRVLGVKVVILELVQFRVHGLVFIGEQSLGFRVQGLGCTVKGSGA